MEITKEQEERILALDPNFFKVGLEVGKWYSHRSDGFNWLMNYQGTEAECYGFNTSRNYGETYLMDLSETDWTLATNQEVENALTIEAEKRGYAKGNFISLTTGLISNQDCYEVVFDDVKNRFWNKLGSVFENGKWAEIIKTITKAEAEKLLNKIII